MKFYSMKCYSIPVQYSHLDYNGNRTVANAISENYPPLLKSDKNAKPTKVHVSVGRIRVCVNMLYGIKTKMPDGELSDKKLPAWVNFKCSPTLKQWLKIMNKGSRFPFFQDLGINKFEPVVIYLDPHHKIADLMTNDEVVHRRGIVEVLHKHVEVNGNLTIRNAIIENYSRLIIGDDGPEKLFVSPKRIEAVIDIAHHGPIEKAMVVFKCAPVLEQWLNRMNQARNVYSFKPQSFRPILLRLDYTRGEAEMFPA